MTFSATNLHANTPVKPPKVYFSRLYSHGVLQHRKSVNWIKGIQLLIFSFLFYFHLFFFLPVSSIFNYHYEWQYTVKTSINFKWKFDIIRRKMVVMEKFLDTHLASFDFLECKSVETRGILPQAQEISEYKYIDKDRNRDRIEWQGLTFHWDLPLLCTKYSLKLLSWLSFFEQL